MIERYRESWITEFLERTLGDWTGVVLMALALGLIIGAYALHSYILKQPVAPKEQNHD